MALAGLTLAATSSTEVKPTAAPAEKTSLTLKSPKDQKEAATKVEPLREADYQKKVSQWIVRLLSQAHYRPHKLDDSFSQEILENFIKTLDPNQTIRNRTG